MSYRRLAPAFVAAAASAALTVALAAQYWGGLLPCALCLYQRYPYGVALALGLAGLLLQRRPKHLAGVLAFAAAAFFVTAAIAAFHVGVEHNWWSAAACGGALAPGASFEEFKAAILAAPTVRCDEVPWSLFGLSMAGYNFLYAAAAGLASLWAAVLIARSRGRWRR